MDIRQIRLEAGLTMAEVAAPMGLGGKQGVSEIERRDDWLVSTLVNYIRGTGAAAVLTVYWPDDKQLEIDFA